MRYLNHFLRLTRRFSSTSFFILFKFGPTVQVDGRLERGKPTTSSLPNLNALYYSYAYVFGMHDLLQVLCNIFSYSTHEIVFETHNLRQTLC